MIFRYPHGVVLLLLSIPAYLQILSKQYDLEHLSALMILISHLKNLSPSGLSLSQNRTGPALALTDCQKMEQ